MIDTNTNIQPETLAKTTAMNLMFRFGMREGEPLKVSEVNTKLDNLSDFENTSWLTSLQIEEGGNKFIFKEVIMSITQERNIVTTTLQGRDGTIKEFISNGDYIITVDAGIIGDTRNDKIDDFDLAKDQYPLEDLKRLREILLQHKAIPVQSKFLDLFGIKTVVVKSFQLQQETHSNRQSIQIQMLSDEPYEIKELKEDYIKVK